MPSLILRNVSKKFGSNPVLKGIDIDVPEGELLVLLGPSGCGKSTLLRLIAGLEEVDSGEIYLGQTRIDQLRPKERRVAMVFQNYSLYPHMTVEKNLAFPLKVAGLKKNETRDMVTRIARLLGLSDRLKSKPGQLSGGQRQRVALGRAIIRQPSIFLLDEPLSNLDADLRIRLRHEIVRIQKELKTTTVYVTHDQVEALTMADRVAVLHDGRVVQVGSPEELYRNPASLFVAEFVGQPRINTIEVADQNEYEAYFGHTRQCGQRFRNNEPVVMGLRPEAIEIIETGDYEGTVTGCEYLGDEYVVSLSFKGTGLTVSGNRAPLSMGKTVRFNFNQDDVLLFDAASGRALKES